ncbi:MAG: 3-phosphoshikimate 1-carboxyvinyltransferase [Clostridia bacterium]|nr:3-phosphoshikimate 1-carboxyvinyltransferase [Clostridia bacterium]
MEIKLNPFAANGKIYAPPSKSVAHRLLICASLKKGKTIIKNVGNSADVIATVRCLNSLGAKIILQNGNALVEGIERVSVGKLLDAGESGSTLRFLMPVACALGADATFTGTQKLLFRPSVLLTSELQRHGVEVNGFSFKGKLFSGTYEIDASVSSQYITGLLFALPLLDGESRIIMQGDVVSKDYINITLSTLEKSGIAYDKSGNSIVIQGNQEYKLPDECVCEGDWSGAAFPLALGAISGKVTVAGLDVNSTQGDRQILEILKKAGAKITVCGDEITVIKGELKGFTHDFEDAPDLAPISAVLAAVCDGESKFTGTKRLKIKESDRVQTTLNTLKSAGITASEKDGEIVILGGSPTGAQYDGANDHRIVMSAAVMSAVATSQSVIKGWRAIDKSYPEFFKDYVSLGGRVDGDI